MAMPTLIRKFNIPKKQSNKLQLTEGSRIGVIGGGPAGSFFSYFVLDMAHRIGLDLHVDVYEPRDFTQPGPPGCNMCGGIISESLVQILAAEGINLPDTVVQRGIDAYMLYMDIGSVRINTPVNEMRIGAVHRGAGPKDLREAKWGSFDGFLQSLTIEKGAHLIPDRVISLSSTDNQISVKTRTSEATYDLLAVTCGVNSPVQNLIKEIDLDYQPPVGAKTFIREYYLTEKVIEQHLGNAMQVFLLDIPRLKFAAGIPKGDYVTICLLGEDIDKDLFQSFLTSKEVRQCMPLGWEPDHFSCQCSPRMNVKAALHPFGDRIVFIGDSGVTRLYKDGIGGAYRAAKAAASTVVFEGTSKHDFMIHYLPTCEQIDSDNATGRLIFGVTRLIQKVRFARKAVLRITLKEQQGTNNDKRMSMILWDMFTGSAPYKDIFRRAMSVPFLLKLFGNMVISIFPSASQKIETQQEH